MLYRGYGVILKIMGPFWVMEYTTAPNIEGYQNGTQISATTHLAGWLWEEVLGGSGKHST